MYKSISDFDTAEKFFEHYSKVSEEDIKIRDVVLARKKPRRLEQQPNLLKEGDSYVYKDYEESYEGIIESYTARFDQGSF